MSHGRRGERRTMEMTAGQAEMFHAYVPYAHRASRWIAGVLRTDPDEALSACLAALVWSVKRYDPSRGASLKTYAWQAFFRAVQRAKRLDRMIGIPSHLFDGDLNRLDIERGCRVMGLARYKDDPDEDYALVDPLADDPAEVAIREEELRWVEAWLSRMPARTRIILKAVHGRGLQRRTVAASLGCSLSNISWIEVRAMAKLRRRAEQWEDASS